MDFRDLSTVVYGERQGNLGTNPWELMAVFGWEHWKCSGPGQVSGSHRVAAAKAGQEGDLIVPHEALGGTAGPCKPL